VAKYTVNINYQVHQLVIVNKRINESRKLGYTVQTVQSVTQVVNNLENLSEFGSFLIKIKKGSITIFVVVLPSGKSFILNY
jgi:hypothetical protein